MDMLNGLKHRRAQKRLERSGQMELTREQRAQTHQDARLGVGIYGALTSVGLTFPAIIFDPVLAPEITQSMVIGALGAAAISLYGLVHGSIYQLIEARRKLRAAKAKQLEAGI